MSNHTSMQTQFKYVTIIISLTAFSLLQANWSSFIPLNLLWAYYVPGTVLGIGYMAMNKTDKAPIFMEFIF